MSLELFGTYDLLCFSNWVVLVFEGAWTDSMIYFTLYHSLFLVHTMLRIESIQRHNSTHGLASRSVKSHNKEIF